jgi:drug/metabolite transporter (DMT)-like permease
MLVLANLYWGLSFPLIKAVTSLNRLFFPGGESWFVTAMAIAPRFALAAILMQFFRRREGGPLSRGEIKQGVGVGLFAAVGALLQTDGMQFTDASTSAFLTQFSAVLIPAWLAVRSRRNPGALIWACSALVLVGVGILGHFNWHTLKFGRGEWESLLCSVFFMGQILWIGKKEFAGNRPGPVTQLMFGVQGVIFVALAACTAPRAGALLLPWGSLPWLGLTLVLTIVCTMGAFSIMTRWQPLITTTEAGLIYCIEPIFAAAFALFLPGMLSVMAAIVYPDEHATTSLVVGGALITLANIIIQTRNWEVRKEKAV